MRILVLNYEFPPIGGGGGQASADICEELAALGHEVQVLTTRGHGLPADLEQNGYRVRRVRTGRRSPSRASFIDMAGYVICGLLPGLRLAKAWKPDVIHAHFAVPTGPLAWFISRVTQVPYVLTAHLGDVPGGVPEKTEAWFRWIKPLTRSIWRDASEVVAVSEHTRKLVRTNYDVEVLVIPNGVRLSGREQARPVGNPPRLIFAGRFQPQKNLLFLVEALQAVRSLDWECQLMGDGPQRVAIQRRLDELGLSSRVAMPGWVTPDEVQKGFAASDVLVMPSLWEGLPVVGLQGLAAGLAIVANRAGGLTELVEDGENGRLCDVGDEPCFVEALRWILDDHDRLWKLKERSLTIAREYDIVRVGNQYQSLYRDIIDTR